MYMLIDLYYMAIDLGLHVIIESHNEKNFNWIADLKPKIIGVNCRDLKIMETDIFWFGKMIDKLPKSSIWVAESGITNSSNLKYIFELGFDAALIGSSLMGNANPGFALKKIIDNM